MEINLFEDIAALLAFYRSPVAPKTVLLVEPNNTHGEVLPGFAQYWLDLGFQVDVLIHSEVAKEHPFCRLSSKALKLYKHSRLTISLIMKSKKIKNYEIIFITTTAYYNQGGKDRKHISFYDYIGRRNYGNTLLFVEHDLADISRFQETPFLHAGTLFTLFKLRHEGQVTQMANPHNFGIIVYTNKSSECTNFITIGSVEKKRRNYSLLEHAVRTLYNRGLTNFKITIVGNGNLQEIPQDLQQFFDIKGRLDFPHMFTCLEKADFLLPLLDVNQAEHKRYLTTGVTGTLQLALGFQKPCLLQAEFANVYELTEASSIIYSANNLANAMEKAIHMAPAEYTDMQGSLGQKANEIYQESQENLRKFAFHTSTQPGDGEGQ